MLRSTQQQKRGPRQANFTNYEKDFLLLCMKQRPILRSHLRVSEVKKLKQKAWIEICGEFKRNKHTRNITNPTTLKMWWGNIRKQVHLGKVDQEIDSLVKELSTPLLMSGASCFGIFQPENGGMFLHSAENSTVKDREDIAFHDFDNSSHKDGKPVEKNFDVAHDNSNIKAEILESLPVQADVISSGQEFQNDNTQLIDSELQADAATTEGDTPSCLSSEVHDGQTFVGTDPTTLPPQLFPMPSEGEVDQPASEDGPGDGAELTPTTGRTDGKSVSKMGQFDENRMRYKLFKLQAALANEKRQQNATQHEAKMEILKLKKALLKKKLEKI